MNPTPGEGGKVIAFPTTNPPEILDAELVDDHTPVPVDTPAVDGSTWLERLRSQQRQPILPSYLTSLSEAKEAGKWVARHYAHKAGYHLARSPLYALRLAVRSPRGLLLLAVATGRWVTDAEGRPARSETATGDKAELYLKLSQQRDRRVQLRWIQLGLVAALGLVAFLVLPHVLPEWVLWSCAVLAVGLLGKLGSPKDKPVIASRAVLSGKVQKLTSDSVVQALSVLGIAGINQALAKNPDAIGFPAPITRDGPGWRADVDLPPGVTVAEVIERRAKLASALGRPLGCVWPEGNAEIHPGRLVLWVGDQDMSKSRQPTWPLRKTGTVDLFRPQPFGTDQRGRWVDITLMFVSMVIGAVPRMGKTFTLRELLLIAGMDARAELHCYDLKGTGDLSPLAPISHRYRAGDEPDDIAYALADLRALAGELRRRAKVIRELPKDLCPENKVTPELAGKKSLGLHPVVLGVDECQKWFEHPDHGAEIEEIVTDLVKRGPALGFVTLLATQRPDARSIPTAISDNAVLRFCLKVTGQQANDMVLGTSSYRNGIRATTLSFRDKGIGYLVGEGDEPRITRSVYLDGPDAEQLAARARTTRVAVGRLTGYAAGLDLTPDEDDGSTLLTDVLAAIGDADKAWSEAIVDRLAELRPAIYGPWADLPTGSAKATQLASALKPFGISTKQVWGTDPATGKGANRMGVKRDWIAQALTERDQQRGHG
ncbi:FtsK/SpoIIIE domain-containing protein [Amycolatopsis cynarae]|uniref:FtsK/SpoIIIE domain-containing protein n=1 Tax=Amycolatopsis cynarae TaxID=2995223 RepID=A0ABY7B3D3_9PSEU|nr:FtsK/SpoIIIE domain-containing protein [Amycolatopsis sp. HUAS 11-8]WAL65949.1 FtsK/SpoIIIE domain-containing protein [Amycolatopsis sp. HUAS 11-8]